MCFQGTRSEHYDTELGKIAFYNVNLDQSLYLVFDSNNPELIYPITCNTIFFFMCLTVIIYYNYKANMKMAGLKHHLTTETRNMHTKMQTFFILQIVYQALSLFLPIIILGFLSSFEFAGQTEVFSTYSSISLRAISVCHPLTIIFCILTNKTTLARIFNIRSAKRMIPITTMT
ncbi:unnamed protein product [Bursaphelenchus okinawaensis]|uniref:Uncharacterized protein n=1 Tax=Bursaphelenchus okinawaensis TaxID=465554 RepID=A0A811KJ83_9BILA|nr:unnamed protein product [Bursaphelenchus okinawaensis]CAG9105719.1 unnamed protein product [Bursaphelenchus okinawaensis]